MKGGNRKMWSGPNNGPSREPSPR